MIVLVSYALATLQQSTPPPTPEAHIEEARRQALAMESAPPEWEISGNVFYSDPPGSEGHAIPILYADRGALHLEARYSYEDLDTASVFVGRNFAFEDEVSVALTPMIGAAFGRTEGVIPALEADVSWKRLAWYAEAEYVIDVDDNDDDYFYSWSTLTYAVTAQLRAGVVIERTKLVDTDFDVQHGLAIELALRRFSCSLYGYNLGTDDDYVVFAVGLAL